MPERSARHAEDDGHPQVTVHGFSMTLAAIPKYTKRQGQYLAFIYYYIKLNGRAPAEADMQRHFLVSAPSVHQMIVTSNVKVLSLAYQDRVAQSSFG